jgi:hypothetical protein
MATSARVPLTAAAASAISRTAQASVHAGHQRLPQPTARALTA